jgi:hypothetical protein
MPSLGRGVPRKPLRRVAQCSMTWVRVSIVFNSGARIGPGKVKLLKSPHSRDRRIFYRTFAAWPCFSQKSSFLRAIPAVQNS